MKKTDRIFVAGHNGLVGSSVFNLLKKNGYKNIITINRKKLDLRDFNKVNNFFKKKKIDYMIMAAARAGGIMANSSNQKDFFLQNIEIQNSLLKLALQKKIKRTIFLGTSCIYPKLSKTPIKEDSLLSGKLEKTNQCYAIAKIAGIKLSEALFEDYKLDIICLMPTNVYGVNDNFDKFNGHVIPAMISKFIQAKKKNLNEIKLLGTGKPIREFVHSNDLANAILTCLKMSKSKTKKLFKSSMPIINIGTGESVSIFKLATTISRLVGFEGKIVFDSNYPDGTYKKNLNSNKIYSLGWKPNIKLTEGLKEVIDKKLY
jgi:GDP-L-fucose synthase